MFYALYHASTETAGLLEEALRDNAVPWEARHLYRGHSLPTFDDRWSGLIVMGGPMNVDETDRYPFLAAEIKLIQKTIAAGRPVLGICLGAQLIAKALGENVFSNSVREVGWHPISLTTEAQEDPLFKEMPAHPTVLHWHGDTFHLPQGAVLLAESPRCKSQAFRYGRNVYALQFHLEATPPMVSSWVRTDEDYVRGAHETPEAIRGATPSAFNALAPVSRRFFSAFLRQTNTRPEAAEMSRPHGTNAHKDV